MKSRRIGSSGLLVLLVAAIGWTAPAASGAQVERLDAWGYPQQAADVRDVPSTSGTAMSKLRFTTELGHAEVYRVSRKLKAGEGPTWLRIDVLGRPNGRVGWVPESALGKLRPIRDELVINRSALRATFFRKERRVWSAPVGIGESRWPTPAGRFYVREAAKVLGGGGFYGSFAFGLSAYSPGLTDWPGGGVIGIHGTNEPELIPGRISHGCIRLRNEHISRLKRLMGVGTPVTIR